MGRLWPARRPVQLVSDLIWMRLADDTPASLAEAAGDGTAAVMLALPGRRPVAGVALPLHEELRDGGSPVSFAALIALSFPTETAVLAFVEQEGGDCRMAAIAEGTPVPNLDRRGSLSELLPLAKSFLADHGSARLLAATDHLERPEPFDLPAFLGSKTAQQAMARARLRSLGGSGRTRVLALALILFAGYIAYDHWQTGHRAEQLRAARAVPEEQVYRAALPAAMAAEGLSGSEARKLVNTLLEMPTYQAGWSVSSIQCTVRQCEFLWKRTLASAGFGDLSDAIGGSDLTFGADQSATKRQTLAPAAPGTLLTTLPNEQGAWASFLTPVQRLGSRVTLTLQKAVPFAAGGVTPASALKRGSVSVRGPLWVLDWVDQFPEWARVRRLAVHSVGPGATVEIDAVLFMR